jgi:uncharacterized coiled-coil protein SlyX
MKDIKSVNEIVKRLDELEVKADEIDSEIDELEDELTEAVIRAKKVEETRKMCEDLYDLYYCLEEVGFTKDEAWMIFMATVNNAHNFKK